MKRDKMEMGVRIAIAIAVLGYVGQVSNGFAADAKLGMILHENTILRDGVLVGELVLTSTCTDGTFKPNIPFSVIGGTIEYHVEHPDGVCRIYTELMAVTLRHTQRIDLAAGQYIKMPICIMMFYENYIFDQVGDHRIKVVYRDKNLIESEWIEIKVLKEGKGHNEYKESHKTYFVSVLTAFQSSKWADSVVGRIDEYGDYSWEQAKLVVYNWSDGKIIRRLLKRKGYKDAEILNGAVIRATQGVELAKRYSVGVDMWEAILERVKNPDMVKFQNDVFVYPVNNYYF